MKISKEDPRLTAYALGEINDPKERAAIEAALAAEPELQAEVEGIRSMGDLLQGGLEAEAGPQLSEFEKAGMERSAASKPARSWTRILISWPVVSTAAAAGLALLFLPQVGIVKFDFEGDRYVEGGFEVRPIEQAEGSPDEEPLRESAAPAKAFQIEGDRTVGGNIAAPVDVARERLVQPGQVPYATKMSQRNQPTPPPQPPAIVVTNPSELEIPALNMDVNVQTSAAYGLDGGSVTESFASDEVRVAAAPPALREPAKEWNTETYDPIEDSDFRSPRIAPLSTFSIDVDTASYANVRRFLHQGQLPPPDAVRIEELINYFSYSDAPPTQSLEDGGDPFAVHLAQASAPWNEKHRLLRVALKGYEMPWAERPASTLVFLLDVSGSMNAANKLPLVKEALTLLTRRLDERDRVAIVVYAGSSGLVLPSTTANNTETIEHALKNLQAGGSTNGGAGIQLAYQVAREHFIEGGNNRVILCTDGDFNVGQTNRGGLTDVAAEQAEAGISLTILGFGMGNFKDDLLEDLSNKGKGSYAYIDSRAEARKVFLQDLASNSFKIAKDVKIQVEFNPEHVQAYRLIGYENRRLKAEDFNNDKKKAGDIGPGHTVTAFYEIVPVGIDFDLPEVDILRYQKEVEGAGGSGELATVKLRYKRPVEEVSRLLTRMVQANDLVGFEEAGDDFRFGAAVAAFGLKLRGSETVGDFGFPLIERVAASAVGVDSGGHRSEFVELVRRAVGLSE